MRAVDLRQYMEARKQQIDRESENVKDFSVFDFNHLPPQPVMRQECQTLIDAMLRFDVSGIPTHLAIVGSRGSGKTLTLRFLGQLLPQQTKLEMCYANCRQHNTSYKVLAHLAEMPARGCSLMELYERFRRRCRQRTVVVLDEVDLMSQKDRRREILYLLSRSDGPFMAVLLSNHPGLLRDLDAATRSSLQPQLVHFRNYNAMELQKILEDRCHRGLCTWDPAVVAQIAALTVKQTNADARVAIKTLFYAVTEPGVQVADSFERARRDIVVDMIADLSEANLLILWAAATSRQGLVKEVYRRYCQLSQSHQEKPFSYVYFYSNLSYLQSLGLIALASVKLGRTYTNRIDAVCEQPVLEPIYRLRFDHS